MNSAQVILDHLARNVLYQLMVASPHIDAGDIDPSELSPDAIAKDLDIDALIEIQRALRFARIQSNAVMRRAQENANKLIIAIQKQKQLGLAEKNYTQP